MIRRRIVLATAAVLAAVPVLGLLAVAPAGAAGDSVVIRNVDN